MPRTYKRRIGARHYRNYTNERLEEALDKIKSKSISIREASKQYGIHRNTLCLKLHDKHKKKHGQQKVFTDEEENLFSAHLITMSTFGFPLTTFDLRCVIKSYLDRQGKSIKCFKENMPGTDWVKSFLKRQPNLSQRVAQNISHARAATDEQIIKDFFDHLQVELQDIPPSNIWNYDETNLVDDPGCQKVITRRGTKYPERIRNSSKACTSLMVCGSADGNVAPLYINYKSQKLWSTWTENGPEGARYNRTSSGWFDYQIFEDWFLNLLLPMLKKLNGPKAIIGDNLSSHLNFKVIQECEANNIRFIALPPNTTHLLQPLDVAFFRPMKIKWRKLLSDWKETAHGSRFTTVPKDEFPSLLKNLMKSLEETAAANLKSAFRKTGIFPLNREEVLNRLCSRVVTSEVEISGKVSESFIDYLDKKRTEATQVRKIRRKKRLNVAPGKSISASDLLDNDPNQDREILIETAQEQPQPSCSFATKKSNRTLRYSSDETSVDEIVTYQESDESVWNETFSSDEQYNDKTAASQDSQDIDISVGRWVVVQYEENYFPGKITSVHSSQLKVNVMVKNGKQWKWPEIKDEIFYQRNEIVMNIDPPIKRGKRNLFDVPQMNTLFN